MLGARAGGGGREVEVSQEIQPRLWHNRMRFSVMTVQSVSDTYRVAHETDQVVAISGPRSSYKSMIMTLIPRQPSHRKMLTITTLLSLLTIIAAAPTRRWADDLGSQ